MRSALRWGAIAHVFGTLLLVTAAAMLVPAGCALLYGEDDLLPLTTSALVIAVLGFPLWFVFRRQQELDTRDALFIAAFGWVAISLVSALPFALHGSIPSLTDGFFEMMSGYTTTGATILRDIEAVPHGLLFWRSETHLLGGMGFLTLTVLFLPHGMGGLRLFRAESSPGQVLTREKFLPRNRDALLWLWAIYLGLNALQVVLLAAGGMPLFDSLIHAFGTVSTSGYSNKNSSLGHYGSAWFDWVTTVFMFLGGVTFMLFYSGLKGDWRAFVRNTEFRWYCGLTAAFCLVVAAILWGNSNYGLVDSLRFGTFQVVSLLTTTGFTTADYELWPQPAQMFLYVVCFLGACAGSTTSGIKVIHFLVIAKYLVGAVKKIFFQPLAIISVRINDRPIDPQVVQLSLAYLIVNIFLIYAGACVISLLDHVTIETAVSAVIACLMNIGPGFGDIGPSENFAHFTPAAKWFLAWTMLVGRLEMFSALVIFYPSFWR